MLLNRRGFATVVFCRQCGGVDGVSALQRDADVSSRRAAGAVSLLQLLDAACRRRCGACGGEYLEQSGFGTERLEAELRERFPGARVARVDRDTIRRRGAIARVLASVAARRDRHPRRHADDREGPRLSGGDARRRRLGRRRPRPGGFPRGERTFQLLTQVVGRAGRGEIRGEAIDPDALSGSLQRPARRRRRTTRRSSRARWSSAARCTIRRPWR